jgi:hypothetical protein
MINTNSAWLAYLSPIGWLIALLQFKQTGSKSSLVLLHLRQMMGLMIILVLLWILQAVYIYSERVNYITIPSYFLLFGLWIKGFSDAINNREKPVPVIGKMLQQACLFVR